METKTFVLLPIMEATAPIHQQLPNGQRARIKKMPRHRPNLQITFVDEHSKNRTIRYKVGHDSIYQDEQIKDGILANAKFTTTEYNDLVFRNGVLVTNKPSAIKFLMAHPECESFKGIRPESVRYAKFQVVDKEAEIKSTNQDLKNRAKAAGKIFDLDLIGAQKLLTRLNGSFFETPNDVEECQNLLIDFLDATDDNGVNEILKEDKSLTVDEKTRVLIGEAIKAKVLSFDEEEGKISKKDAAGKWIPVREIAVSYTPDEKTRVFSDFLNTDEGKALKGDLEKEVEASRK